MGAIDKYTRTTEILWRKRDSTARPLPQEESTPTLALTGFYCFSRPLTSKKVLLYYTKVCFGWLSLQTQARVSLNTSKEDICNVKGEMVETSYAPYLEGLAQILGR